MIALMPHYFFHILHPDDGRIPDEEGLVLRDLTAARQEAVDGLHDLITDAGNDGSRVSELAIRIADEAGGVLDTITARQILQ